MIENNGVVRCPCGEPVGAALIGTPAEIEANPDIMIRCYACAAVQEAESILNRSDRDHQESA